MKLIHYTEKPFKFDWDYKYKDSRLSAPDKPDGLWFSVEHETEDYYGWADWCQDNNFRLNGLENKYNIQVSDKASILELTSIEDMLEFNEIYGIPFETPMTELFGETARVNEIKWDQVYERYDGICIYPYHWQARMDDPVLLVLRLGLQFGLYLEFKCYNRGD